MDQDAAQLSDGDGSRAVRLLLMLLVAIGAGIVLALTVGGPPAQADEATPDSGPPRSVVGVVAGGLTSATGRLTPLVDAVPAATTAIGRADSVAGLVTPVTGLLDDQLVAPVGGLLGDTGEGLAEVVGPVFGLLRPVDAVLGASLTHPFVSAAVASWASTATIAAAAGPLLALAVPVDLPGGAGLPAGGPSPGGASASSVLSPPLIAGLLGAAFAMLLASARRRMFDDAIPASPVFDTDSSPD